MANLRGAINDSQINIQVDDTSDFPVNGGVVTLEGESVRYTTATDKAILGCERGYNGSSAADHADHTSVDLQDTSAPLYQLQEYQGHGAPSDHFTGIGFASKGTRYTDLDSALMYVNTGDASDPMWQPFAEGASGGAAGPVGSVQLSDGAGALIAVTDLIFDDGTKTLQLPSASILKSVDSGLQIDTGGAGSIFILGQGDAVLAPASGVTQATCDILFNGGNHTLDSDGTLILRADNSGLFINSDNGGGIILNASGSIDGTGSDEVRWNSPLIILKDVTGTIEAFKFDTSVFSLTTPSTEPLLIKTNGGGNIWEFDAAGVTHMPGDFYAVKGNTSVEFRDSFGATRLNLVDTASAYMQVNGDVSANLSFNNSDESVTYAYITSTSSGTQLVENHSGLEISLNHDGVELHLSANSNAQLHLNDSDSGFNGGALLEASGVGHVRLRQGTSTVWDFAPGGGFVLPNLGGSPTATEGAIYYDSGTHHLYVYDGTTWKQCDN